jgi:hypothetical protein
MWARSPHSAEAAHHRDAAAAASQGLRTVNFMPESPPRSASTRPLTVAPIQGQLRDWEGLMTNEHMAASYAANSRDASGRYVGPAQQTRVEVKREGPPSVAVLAPAVATARQTIARGSARTLGPSPGGQQQQGGTMQQRVHDRPEHVVDHQTFLEYKRREFARRQEAERQGAEYKPRAYSEVFARNLPGGAAYDPNVTNLNFEGRSQHTLQRQLVGTRDEIAWLHPPQIPPPLNWNGFWDLCPGHELLLQLMAVSGVTPVNSPSLVQHFMYQELLSCFQRMQYGTYLVHYRKGEPPHERYFYIKSLPLANKAQYCPFLCWATHKNAHQAADCIPLCNVMWVTTGLDTPNLAKYAVGDGEHVNGPFVGKRRVEMLAYGAFALWIFDGKKTKCVELLATDPLVFTMWMKLLEDVAQLNAALDTGGSVRALQRQLEDLRVAGELDRAITQEEPTRGGFLTSLFGPKYAERGNR